MNSLKLSIIVPFYNVEKYIEQCIRSLYEQDIPQDEYEVICVDDCSLDGTRTIVEKLQKEFLSLRLVCHNDNKKQGGARNTGLKIAQGEYVWYVDSDDYICPNILGRLLYTALSEQLSALHFDYLIDSDGRIQSGAKHPSTECHRGSDLFFSPLFVWWQDFISPWQVIVRRDFLLQHSLFFEEGVQYEDTDYSIKLYALLEDVKHINLRPYIYRKNPNSITQKQYGIDHIRYWILLCIRLHKLKIQYCTNEYDARFQSVIKALIKDYLIQSMRVYRQIPTAERKEICKFLRQQKAFYLYSYLSLKQIYTVLFL